MSVIGIEKTQNKIRMAFDSQSTTGDSNRYHDTDQKGFAVDSFIIGATGNVITKQYLKEFISKRKNLKLDKCYDVCELIQEFFEHHKDNTRLIDKEYLGDVLIADSKKIFSIDLKFFSCREINDYSFIGSGAGLAEGAYMMHKKLEEEAKFKSDALKNSILIACEKDIYSGGPVNVIEMGLKF